MPTTQRPFFFNFLAAFRAHSALKSPATTASGPASATAALSTQAGNTTTTSQISQSISPSSPSPPSPTTAPRTIAASSAHKTPSTLVSAFSPPNTGHGNQHTSRHHTRHPSNNPMSRSPAGGGGGPGAFGNNKHRRSSDSSSEGGFRDALGGEKWFIGGRTAQGEERFYRLGVVRRERSGDRASLDRMSL